MSTFPKAKDDKIKFFEERVAGWIADPAAVGLTAAQAADIAAMTTNARIAYLAAQQGKQDTKNLVLNQDTAIDEMMDLGSILVATIRVFADYTGVNSGSADAVAVYDAASLSPYNQAEPAAMPVAATNLQAELLNSGGIKLTWEGTTANGTVYTIWRRDGVTSSYNQIATSGSKSFEDETVPAGATEIGYFLKTVRDEFTSGDSEPIAVRLGVPDSGDQTPLSLAA